MKGKEVLDAIGVRDTFSVFANAFRQHELDVIGQGWNRTRAKLEARLADPKHSEATYDALLKSYVDNVLYTHKAVMLWAVERSLAQALANELDAFVAQDSPYRASYPLPLPSTLLNEPLPLGVPTAVDRSDGRHTLIYASKRSITEEEVLPQESIPESLKGAGFTELVAKKKRIFPVFDSISVSPERGLVEMRIDQAKSMSEKDVFKYRETLRARFNARASELLGVDNLLGNALNLVDALHVLYSGKDWVVQRIGHVNEGGYINSNRGRHRTSDVRVDKYHKNGEAAIDHLQLWSISAVFNSPSKGSAPVLILEGHSSMLSAVEPFMDLARVIDCTSQQDYDLVLGTLLNCLRPATATAPVLHTLSNALASEPQ
ncbi:hypothetical protein [Ralstonia sp. 25mfcol4.1]|uniref:hypothetical protein n=1 Tax=Ralstonia sp. 25mfcol4.1 TaxID=1761899 RepID=UPI000406C79D|nr:hypothetical protein [Ralstonia sp. 25mfcol4.1]